MAYSSPPGEETNGEGTTHQSAQPVTYSPVKLTRQTPAFTT